MIRKTGLQKKVSSIFDGVEIPSGSKSVQSVLAGSADPCQQADHGNSERIMPGRTPLGSSAVGVLEDDVAVSSPAVSESAKFVKSISPAEHQKNIKLFVLTAVIIIFWTSITVRLYVFGPEKKNRASKSTASTKKIEGTDSKDVVIEWPVPAQVGENVRDITVSDGRANASASTGAIVVRGILLSENKSSALIGKSIVHIGDQVAGATVVTITRKTVEFEKDGKRWGQQVEK